jgi:membrane-bound lytic murein transglycosylase MltF
MHKFIFIEKKEIDEKIDALPSEFDPVLYDVRFSFIEDMDARLAIFDCAKELSFYINDPYGFMIALACTESSFGKKVEGPGGERGIMQIHPEWALRKNVDPQYFDDHYNNVCFATQLLKDLFLKYSDPFLVLQVYNTGNFKKKNKKYIEKFIDCYLKINLTKNLKELK